MLFKKLRKPLILQFERPKGRSINSSCSIKGAIHHQTRRGDSPHRRIEVSGTSLLMRQAVDGMLLHLTFRYSRKYHWPMKIFIGSLHAGAAPNTISEKARMTGTTRTFNRDILKDYQQIMAPIIKGVCDSMGASYEFKFTPGYPSLKMTLIRSSS